eukprot:g4689.t1
MSGVKNGFLDETLKMLGLSVLSGAVVGGLILSFLPRQQARNAQETSRNITQKRIQPTDSGALAIREGFSMAEAKEHSDRAAKHA